ncbi:hypothetical protein M0R45_021593 [Rubus argutus]|uniref:Uncharacterized protein n=1 Tax=Rubus argutus TaxID=59490 RepID=A0AAW1XBS0_RUBAR
MIKQILGRLPRKPSKSADNREFGGSSASSLNASISSRKSDLASDRPINSNTIPFSDFDDASPKHLKEKDIKRQTLLELVDYVSSASGKFNETIIQEAIKMVTVNLFRSLSPQPRENKVVEAFDMEDEEPLMDPAWSHLQIVYEFFLRFVASPETDAKLAKRYIDQSFVLKLLDLFDSEDPREREYLKTILHRIYGKFMVHRPFIRKGINYILPFHF